MEERVHLEGVAAETREQREVIRRQQPRGPVVDQVGDALDDGRARAQLVGERGQVQAELVRRGQPLGGRRLTGPIRAAARLGEVLASRAEGADLGGQRRGGAALSDVGGGAELDRPRLRVARWRTRTAR